MAVGYSRGLQLNQKSHLVHHREAERERERERERYRDGQRAREAYPSSRT